MKLEISKEGSVPTTTHILRFVIQRRRQWANDLLWEVFTGDVPDYQNHPHTHYSLLVYGGETAVRPGTIVTEEYMGGQMTPVVVAGFIHDCRPYLTELSAQKQRQYQLQAERLELELRRAQNGVADAAVLLLALEQGVPIPPKVQ